MIFFENSEGVCKFAQQIVIFMNLRQRNNLLITLVALIAIAVVALAAWRSPRGQEWVAQWRGDTIAQPQVSMPTLVDTADASYEYGAPVADLMAQSPADTVTAAADTVPTRNEIEQAVFDTQQKFDELCATHEKWRQKPTRALRRRGLELRSEVITQVGLLMPLARQYHYKRGIRLATEIRERALAMKFEQSDE